ncbi:hypothetical protein BGW37DRAFT_141723 [Umbelopsis sp. PMI_123]|nr:hypothetical protein BGW37DRAFT_141723 [Umbelopsis sp. PMI_123]
MDSDANPEDDEVIHIPTNSYANGAKLQSTTLRKQFKLIEHRRKVRKGTPIHLPSTSKAESAGPKRPATVASGSQLHPLLSEPSRTTLLPSNLYKIVGSTSKQLDNVTASTSSLSVSNMDHPASRSTATAHTHRLEGTNDNSEETRKMKRNSMVEISSDEDDQKAKKDLQPYDKKKLFEIPNISTKRSSIVSRLKRRNGTDAVPSATPISKKRRSSWDVRSIESRQEKDSGSQHIASTSQHTVDTTHTNMTVLQSLSLSNIVCDGKRVPNSPSKLQKMIVTKNNEIIFKSQSNDSKFFKLVPRHSIRTLEYYAGNSSGLHMKLHDETKITVVLSPSIEANEFARFLKSLELDNFCIAPFEKAEWEKIVASEGLPLLTNIRTHDALKEANLDIQPPGADPTKEKPSSQVLSSENTTADQILFVYPFTGYGGITLSKADEARLDDGEFLNDNIIDFYMKWILDQLQTRDPELANQVHIFNSFFYKRLTQRNRNSRKEETVYDRVKKWTAKINLFEKSYVFIPINENWHWYLAIICNLKKMIPSAAGSEYAKEVPFATEIAAAVCSGDSNLGQIGGETVLSPMDVDGSNDTNSSTTSPQTPESLQEAPKRLNLRSNDSLDDIGESPNSPWIFLLDSLGNRHPKSFQCLQQYLAAEARERMNVDLDRDGCKPLSCYGKVPRQRNYCDCGVYLLHYAEVFLSDPRKYLTLLSVSDIECNERFKQCNIYRFGC